MKTESTITLLLTHNNIQLICLRLLSAALKKYRSRNKSRTFNALTTAAKKPEKTPIPIRLREQLFYQIFEITLQVLPWTPKSVLISAICSYRHSFFPPIRSRIPFALLLPLYFSQSHRCTFKAPKTQTKIIRQGQSLLPNIHRQPKTGRPARSYHFNLHCQPIPYSQKGNCQLVSLGYKSTPIITKRLLIVHKTFPLFWRRNSAEL